MDTTAITMGDALASPRPWFRWAGLAAIISAVAAVAADIAVITLIESATFLSTSVSATAVGKHSWFVDAAMCFTGAAIAALAFALHHWNIDRGRYRIGIFCLAALSLTIFLIAGWSAYDPGQVPDFGFHMMQVYALSALFPLAALTLARGFSKIHRNWGYFSIAIAVLWMISGPVYAITPEALEGLFQRICFALMLIWVAGVGVLLVRAAARRGRVDPEPEGA